MSDDFGSMGIIIPTKIKPNIEDYDVEKGYCSAWGYAMSVGGSTSNFANNPYARMVHSELFPLYKMCLKDGDNKTKEFIENLIFKACRLAGDIPRSPIFNDDGTELLKTTLDSLRELETVSSKEIYDGKEYGLNSCGVDFLYSFYPNIWDVAKNTAPVSVREAFNTDDKLKRAIRKTLTFSDSIWDLSSWIRMIGTGYCVNFRPASAKAIYENFAPKEGAKVYDYANGYGARCLGAYFANNVEEYVSVDVNTKTVENTYALQDFLNKNFQSINKNKKMTTHLCGSEEFLQKYPQYKGYFDLSFSSPQYFDTEIYCKEETQSCFKFPKLNSWVKGFYIPTIHNAIDVLKPGGIFMINIFEKLHLGKGSEKIDLKAITQLIAKQKGFYLYKSDKYLLRSMPGSAGKNEDGTHKKREREIGSNFEAVWNFKHYETLYSEGLIDEDFYSKCKADDSR